MTAAGPEADANMIPPSFPEAPTPSEDPGKRAKIGFGWLNVSFRLLSSMWSRLNPKSRSTLRIIICFVVVVVVARVWLIPLALRWKSGPAWENFLQSFATSPAAAGTAAVVAAVIAATSFSRGLKHTKEEARDKAWWDKFEWVTDRIVPRDPKQERLPRGLATDLLRSLEGTSEGEFQLAAVGGIKRTYIEGEETDPATATLGDLKAQWREIQTFADSSWHSGTVRAHIRSYAYNLAVAVALRETWDARRMKFDPLSRKGRDRIEVLVAHDRLSAVVTTKYLGENASTSDLGPSVRLIERLVIEKKLNLIVVANRDFSWRQRYIKDRNRDRDAVLVVHWEQKHGAEALHDRIQKALREFAPPADLQTKDMHDNGLA